MVGEKEKTRFLQLASHELRTPLTSLRGAIRLLIEHRNDLPCETTDAMLEMLERSAARLESTIVDLLAASELDGPQPNATELGALVEFVPVVDVVSELTQSLPVNGHRVSLCHDGPDLRVRANREDVSEVVRRILDNAVKFTGEHGRIDVHVGYTGGFAVISIEDDGPGIPSEDQRRIFDRYVTLGDLMTRRSNGLGVGLFIARQLVESMGGLVWVESTPGRGATFRVKLPLA